jgi:hypothetical protein
MFGFLRKNTVKKGLTAAASGLQADATELVGFFNEVGTVAGSDNSVRLPKPSAQGGVFLIVRNAGANRLRLYPHVGGKINGLSTDAALAVQPESLPSYPGEMYLCVAENGTDWNCHSLVLTNSNGDKAIQGNYACLNDFSIGGKLVTYGLLYRPYTEVTAFAGGGQGSATAVGLGVTVVATCATNGDSVKLPANAFIGGLELEVWNLGAASCDVFPPVGGKINALSANAALSIAAGAKAVFRSRDANSGLDWVGG